MRHVLQVLRVVRDGVSVDPETGSFSPAIQGLYHTSFPKSVDNWFTVKNQALRATKPKSLEQCSFDELTGADPKRMDYALLVWGENRFGHSPKSVFSIREFDRTGVSKFLHFKTEEEARTIFHLIQNSSTSHGIAKILGLQPEGADFNMVKVTRSVPKSELRAEDQFRDTVILAVTPTII